MIKKSQNREQTSAQSFDMSCFISQSTHNSALANNMQSSLFVRNYRQGWAYRSRTVANMKSENLNTIFDMCKKMKERIQPLKLSYCLQRLTQSLTQIQTLQQSYMQTSKSSVQKPWSIYQEQIFSRMLKNLPLQWEMPLNILCIMKLIISSKRIKSLMSTIV